MNNQIIATTDSYKFLPLERALQGLSGVGLKAIELLCASEWEPHFDPSTATHAERSQLERLLNNYDLQVVSVSGHSNLASKEGFSKFQDRLRFADSMDIDIINTGVGDLSSEPKRQLLYRNLSEIALNAEKMNIVVALEPHGDWASSGQALYQILHEVGSDSIRINYDTANVIFYSGIRPEDDIEKVADKVAHVHMKDKIGGKKVWNFPGLGHGDIDFIKIIDTLDRSGYKGPFSIEIELTHETERNGELIDKAFRDSLEYLKSLNRFDHVPLSSISK